MLTEPTLHTSLQLMGNLSLNVPIIQLFVWQCSLLHLTMFIKLFFSFFVKTCLFHMYLSLMIDMKIFRPYQYFILITTFS